jgi:hypothetical protein
MLMGTAAALGAMASAKALKAQGAKRDLAQRPQNDSEPMLVRHTTNSSAPEDTAVRLEDLQPLAP